MERWEDGVQSRNGAKSHKEEIMVVNDRPGILGLFT